MQLTSEAAKMTIPWLAERGLLFEPYIFHHVWPFFVCPIPPHRPKMRQYLSRCSWHTRRYLYRLMCHALLIDGWDYDEVFQQPSVYQDKSLVWWAKHKELFREFFDAVKIGMGCLRVTVPVFHCYFSQAHKNNAVVNLPRVAFLPLRSAPNASAVLAAEHEHKALICLRVVVQCQDRANQVAVPKVMLKDLIRYRKSKEVRGLRKAVARLVSCVAEGETNLLREAKLEVTRAHRNLRALGLAGRIGKLVTYLSLPVSVVEAAFKLPSVTGLTLATTGASIQLTIDTQEKANRWVARDF